MKINNQNEIVKKASNLIEKKNYRNAKYILEKFIQDIKNSKIDVNLYYALYLACYGLKEIKNAKKYLEKCLKINDKNHIRLNNLAHIYFKEGNTYKAEKFYLKSLELKNDYLLAILNLAILYQNTGRLEESKKFYLDAIRINPKKISIYFDLNRIDKNFLNEEKIKYIENLMKNEKLDLADISYGLFLLAEHEKKKKNFVKELGYLSKANYQGFNCSKDKNIITLNYWKNIIPKEYKKFHFINDNKENELIKFKPIFIIGLPRSGSTVTEVLLSSDNTKIYSLGEASIFYSIIAKEFSNKKNSTIDLKMINNKILEIFNEKNINIKNKIFIDKSLENFFYVDVILKVFPKAKFIVTSRNIEDNIFAIYKQSLSKISWTHSLENIIDYIDNYLKIINYFIKKYPDKIFSIRLEEFTNNPEEISKKLYSFCNLNWTHKVLNFNNRDNLIISTASNIQIRDNIKKYDHEKYKPYKEFLKKFLHKYHWINVE